jgi:hypothetical protein
MSNTTDRLAYDHSLNGLGYPLRLLEATKAISSKGNPMIKFKVEIYNAKPEKFRPQDISKPAQDVMVDINGVEISGQVSLSPRAEVFYRPFFSSFGVACPTTEELATYDPSGLRGREGAGVCVSTLKEDVNEVTGEVIVNPLTGKPVMRGRREVKQWLGRE